MATATAIALVIDAVRLPIYLWHYSADVFAVWRVVLEASVGVIPGTIFGNRMLLKIPDRWFRPVVALILAALGVSMLLRA